jgi:PAS domain S-box-containing protein
MAKKPAYGELRQEVKELKKEATKRKRLEKALRGSETILRQVIDLVPHAIYAYDRNGLHLLANRKAAELLGTTVEELTGALFGDIFHNEEQLSRFLADTRQVITKGEPKFVAEEPISDAEGNLRFLQTTKIPFLWPASGEQVVLGVSTDITERKQAEEALGEISDFKEKIIFESPIGMSIYDASGKCVAANDSIAELIGGTRNQVLEQNYNNIKSWKKSGLFDKAKSAVREKFKETS